MVFEKTFLLYFVIKTKCTCIKKTHVLPCLKSVESFIDQWYTGRMIFQKAFRYRLKPNKGQLDLFVRFAGAARWVYNHGLARRKEFYEAEGKTLSYFDQNKELTQLKRAEETSWLKEVHSQILQQSLRDLDRAFGHFFRRVRNGEKPGYPRFKCRGEHDAFRFPQGFSVQGDKVFLPKIGWVRFVETRCIEGTIQQVTVVREGDHWYVCFSCVLEKAVPSLPLSEEKGVGIDVGLMRFATLAVGKSHREVIIAHPKFLSQGLERLRYLSRSFSKKQKKGKNGQKAKRKLLAWHAYVRNCRQDFVHKLSTQIVKNHDYICVESLNIRKMVQESPAERARSIGDSGWRHFLTCLKYKAVEQGKVFVEAPIGFASSQICSCCGRRRAISLKERRYCCICGLEMDRDLNAAINIKAAGMSVFKACGAAP